MKEQKYDSEDLLQGLLERYPNLLAGDQMDSGSPRRWLLISREAGIPSEEGSGERWSVDHLFLDQDSVPTLVEVKRSSDSRIRREVVGQMLDYAANAVVYWPVETIRAKFEERCDSENLDPDQTLGEFLGVEADPEEFWQKVKTNLQAGKVRLLFVADEIPSELRRIVEFLNIQMDPAEVLALEINQYVGENLKTLVPRVIGQTEEAKYKKGKGSSETKQWDEKSFFQKIENNQGKEICDIARRIFEWSKSNMPRIWWGRGEIDGSFVPVLDYKGIDYYLFAIRTGFSKNAHIQIQFGPLSSRPPFDNENLRKELLKKLNDIPSVDLPDDSLSRYPGIPLNLLSDEATLQQFLNAMEWAIQEVKTKQ